MGIDIKSADLFTRRSIVVRDDHLLIAEATGHKDSLIKIHFDKIQKVVIWRTIPKVRFSVYMMLTLLISLPFFLTRDNALTGWIILLVCGAINIIRTFAYQVTHFRIFRGKSLYEFCAVVSRKKKESFIRKIRRAVTQFRQEHDIQDQATDLSSHSDLSQ